MLSSCGVKKQDSEVKTTLADFQGFWSVSDEEAKKTDSQQPLVLEVKADSTVIVNPENIGELMPDKWKIIEESNAFYLTKFIGQTNIEAEKGNVELQNNKTQMAINVKNKAGQVVKVTATKVTPEQAQVRIQELNKRIIDALAKLMIEEELKKINKEAKNNPLPRENKPETKENPNIPGDTDGIEYDNKGQVKSLTMVKFTVDGKTTEMRSNNSLLCSYTHSSPIDKQPELNFYIWGAQTATGAKMQLSKLANKNSHDITVSEDVLNPTGSVTFKTSGDTWYELADSLDIKIDNFPPSNCHFDLTWSDELIDKRTVKGKFVCKNLKQNVAGLDRAFDITGEFKCIRYSID
ncbi:MAG: hypothetical protein HY072_10480 [Deltaproteobacteria bacterium]|nr:hypothetical protein [Deltaproteobacteria bacterium]